MQLKEEGSKIILYIQYKVKLPEFGNSFTQTLQLVGGTEKKKTKDGHQHFSSYQQKI